MRRRKFITAGGIATATTVAGCLGSAQESGDHQGESGRTITVSESGETETEPDLAVINVSVEATGDSAGAVRDDLAEQAEDLTAALLDAGIDADAITTGRFSIRERYDERRIREADSPPDSPEDAEEYRYYQGTHSLTIEVDDVDRAGEIVDAAVDGGADDVDRIEFTLSDERRENLREDALENALGNAQSEADAIASEIGATVQQPTHIDSSGGRVSPVYEDAAADVALETPTQEAAQRTTLNPDDVTVSASVTVEYKIS